MKLILSNICKKYKNTVLNQISFEVESGILGLLGENGAGKTTLIEIIATLIKPTDGTVYYDDFTFENDLYKIRHQIGYLPQKFDFFPNLTVEEALYYICKLKGINNKEQRAIEIDEKIRQVGLEEQKKKKFCMLSGGMKQRLGIAQALIGNPKILLVDEPTVGLDPHERVAFRQLLSSLAQERLIILSTHIIEDVAMTSDMVLVLHKGKVNYFGHISSLIESVRGKVWLYKGDSIVKDIQQQGIIIGSHPTDTGIEVRFLAEHKIANSVLVSPTLEDAYIYTNRKRGTN